MQFLFSSKVNNDHITSLTEDQVDRAINYLYFDSNVSLVDIAIHIQVSKVVRLALMRGNLDSSLKYLGELVDP